MFYGKKIALKIVKNREIPAESELKIRIRSAMMTMAFLGILTILFKYEQHIE